MNILLSKPSKILFFLLLFITGYASNLWAQQNKISFSPLGSSIYTGKITQLESFEVPKKYSEKAAQAWYDEILTEHNKSLLSIFKDDKLIADTLLLNKCNNILNRISAGNKQFRFDNIKLYINRSVVANAACWGDGTILVNLGLFLWVDNDDELALVIAHEIAHQLLGHTESKIDKSITMLTSDDFKAELKNIKRSDYGKYDRFRKLMKGLSMETGKHSTYKESEADSLGVILARNANFNIVNAAPILLKLDKVDELFTSPALYVLKDFFEKAPIDPAYFKPKPKYNGLSSVKVTMNADKDFDSIKTHPDCIKRYAVIMGKAEPVSLHCCTDLTNMNRNYKERAMLEMVRFLYEKNSLGLCVHLSLFAIKNNYDPVIYNYFLSLCFSDLYYRDKKLERFNAANAYASPGANLKAVQDFLFDLSSADIEALSVWCLNQHTNPNTEDFEFAKLMYNTKIKMKEVSLTYADFSKRFPASKYQYLIQKK